VDDREFLIELERIRAERKSPLLVWAGNLVWVGLGNLLVGDKSGWVTGFITWVVLFLAAGMAAAGFVPGLLLFPVWYVVISLSGTNFANRQYVQAIEQLKRRYEASKDQPSA
jgi:tellurite resistance protein TehA-like permease